MTLINRMARLFRADAHALMDRLEEPEVLLAGALRDMEAAHAATAREVGVVRDRLARTQNQMQTLEEQIEAAGEELEICLDAAEEDLARTVIRRRLHLEKQQHARQQVLADGRTQLNELEASLKREAEQIAALREKQALLAPDEDDAPVEITPADADQVEVILLREKRRRAS